MFYKIPAPVGGINTKDSIVRMKKYYALKLVNFFPAEGLVTIRKGHTASSTNIGGSSNPKDVSQLFVHRYGSTEKLYAVSDNKIYDVTPTFNSAGNVVVQDNPTALSLTETITKSRFNYINFNGHCILVNGQNQPLRINDSGNFVAHGWTGTGLTATNLFSVTAWKNRLLFLEKDSPNVWYGGVDSIAGTLNKFPVGRVSQFGGNVSAINSMTMDSGTGIDDLLAIFLDSGVMLLYQGTDISDASKINLIGEFNIGRTVGENPTLQYGGDILVATDQGVTSVRGLLQPQPTGTYLRKTDKIESAFSADVRQYGDVPGWQVFFYPRANWLLVNVPERENKEAHQWVQNTQTGAWTRFQGMSATNFALYDNNLYFSAPSGVVCIADRGNSDSGTAIQGEIVTAFNTLSKAGEKIIRGLQPNIYSTSGVSLHVYPLVDYDTNIRGISLTAVSVPARGWRRAWRTPWGKSVTPHKNWIYSAASGTAVAIGFRSLTRGHQLSLIECDVNFDLLRGRL